jgi:hypothetical protein
METHTYTYTHTGNEHKKERQTDGRRAIKVGKIVLMKNVLRAIKNVSFITARR